MNPTAIIEESRRAALMLEVGLEALAAGKVSAAEMALGHVRAALQAISILARAREEVERKLVTIAMDSEAAERVLRALGEVERFAGHASLIHGGLQCGRSGAPTCHVEEFCREVRVVAALRRGLAKAIAEMLEGDWTLSGEGGEASRPHDAPPPPAEASL